MKCYLHRAMDLGDSLEQPTCAKFQENDSKKLKLHSQTNYAD